MWCGNRKNARGEPTEVCTTRCDTKAASYRQCHGVCPEVRYAQTGLRRLTESLSILGKMKLGQHVDPDLFDVFMWERVYETYAKQYMSSEQIDDVDLSKVPGYVSPPLN